MGLVRILNYQPEHQPYFEKFNRDWIEEYFEMEPVDERFRRRGIAEALSLASFKKAKEMGAETVILYSNSILTGAIRLYEKIGFRHVPLGDTEYKRSDVKMKIEISGIAGSTLQPLNPSTLSTISTI